MPGDIARLVIEIDSNGVVTGKAALEGLTDAGKKAEDQNKKHRASLTELNQGLEIARKAFDLLKGAVVDSVAEFVDAEKAQVKLEAVLRATGQAAGRTAQDLNNMANSLAGKTIFDDDTITNAQALMLTFKNVGGEIYDRTIPAVLDLSSAFGMDLAGASVMLGKALEDPTQGLTALRRVGVSFTDQQQEEIKALMDAGEAAKAQGEILDVLKGQVGGVAEAMGASASGSIARMENAVHNLQEAFGRLVATNFQPLIDSLTRVMDVMSGNAFDVAGFVGKDASAQRESIFGADQGALDKMLKGISDYQSFAPEGSALWKKLNNLEGLILGRIDELKKSGKYGAGTPMGAPSGAVQGPPASWEYTPNGYDGRDRFTPFVDPAAAAQARIDRGTIPYQEIPTSGGALPDWMAQPGATGGPLAGAVPDTPGELSAKAKAILEIRDALGSTYEEADTLAATFDRMDKAMQSIAAQGIAQGFQEIGAAMAQGGNSAEAFGQAMERIGIQVAEQIGGLMIATGLELLVKSGGLDPMGWAMIAAGGGLEMAGGALGASMKSDSSAPRSALSASSSSSSSSQAPAQVTVNNYAGVQVTTTERQGPSGKELQIAIRAAVAGEIAGGGLDRVMTQRYGVQTPGRSAS